MLLPRFLTRRCGSAAAPALVAVAVTYGCGSSAGSRTGDPTAPSDTVAAAVSETATPVTGSPTDYDALMALVGDARVVLLGESTHGTHEYYRERMRITQRLVEEKGFNAVAIEGDWPESYRVNEYVRGLGTDESAEQVLSGYTRFPSWMWNNTDVRDLVSWLRTHNDAQPVAGDVGFYGLDVYSLFGSADAVVRYLSTVDPAAAERARTRYACFNPYRADPQHYGAAAVSPGASCRTQAAEELAELTQRAATRPADPVQAELLFSALRNAHSVANAEEYFRTLYEGGTSTWNLRDQHMAEAVDALDQHLSAAAGKPAKVVVWAHNTHAGDARVTQVGEAGEHNVGQLMRQRHGEEAVLVGFLSYTGTVFAAPDWDRPGRVYDMLPALPGSYSDVLHAAQPNEFLLVLRGAAERLGSQLGEPRLERAIGVVYRPETERQSHYFLARLSRQFDAAVFFDTTSAVRPLTR